MAPKQYVHPRKYNPDQPELFSPEMLGESPMIDAPSPAEPDPEEQIPAATEEEETDESLDSDTFAVTAPPEDTIFFMSFGSGSSGNCSYVGDRRSGFLIDAGIDPEKVKNALQSKGISMEKVRGVVITHDHGDHVRFLYSLLKNNRHMRLYCTPKVLNGILRRHSISRRIKDYHRAIYKEFEFKVGNFTLIPFEVLHDGSDNCGFFITHGLTRLGVATDLGCISPRADFYLSQTQFLVLESNYDLQMLINGRYLDHLKARIRTDNGHLDNRDAARFIAKIYSPALKYVFLCHLSHDNNTPELAIQTHHEIIGEAHPNITFGDGTNENTTDLQLIALPRYDATQLYALRGTTAK